MRVNQSLPLRRARTHATPHSRSLSRRTNKPKKKKNAPRRRHGVVATKQNTNEKGERRERRTGVSGRVGACVFPVTGLRVARNARVLWAGLRRQLCGAQTDCVRIRSPLPRGADRHDRHSHTTHSQERHKRGRADCWRCCRLCLRTHCGCHCCLCYGCLPFGVACRRSRSCAVRCAAPRLAFLRGCLCCTVRFSAACCCCLCDSIRRCCEQCDFRCQQQQRQACGGGASSDPQLSGRDVDA
jgi:hypothetical protein